MHPSPAQTRRIGVSAGQGGRDGPGRTCPTTTHGFLGGTERGLSGRCSGSGTAQLGRCAVGAGGGRSVGAAASAWRTTIRRFSRVWRAWSSRMPMTAVTSCWTSGSTRSRTACPAGVRSTRTRRRSAGLRRRLSWQTHPTARLRSRSPCVVAWSPQRQRRQLTAPGWEPAVTSSFHPLKAANTSPFSRSGTLK